MPVRSFHTINGKIRGMTQNSASVPLRTTYFHDALGNVVATTNQYGVAKPAVRYSDWGAKVFDNGGWGALSFGWVGGWGFRALGSRYSDTYAEARNYSSSEGRWTTRDQTWASETQYLGAASSGFVTRLIDIAGPKSDQGCPLQTVNRSLPASVTGVCGKTVVTTLPEFRGRGSFIQKVTLTYAVFSCEGSPYLDLYLPSGSAWYEGLYVGDTPRVVIDNRRITRVTGCAYGVETISFESGFACGYNAQRPPWKKDQFPYNEVSGSMWTIETLPADVKWTPLSSGYVNLIFNCCSDPIYLDGWAELK